MNATRKRLTLFKHNTWITSSSIADGAIHSWAGSWACLCKYFMIAMKIAPPSQMIALSTPIFVIQPIMINIIYQILNSNHCHWLLWIIRLIYSFQGASFSFSLNKTNSINQSMNEEEWFITHSFLCFIDAFDCPYRFLFKLYCAIPIPIMLIKCIGSVSLIYLYLLISINRVI